MIGQAEPNSKAEFADLFRNNRWVGSMPKVTIRPSAATAVAHWQARGIRRICEERGPPPARAQGVAIAFGGEKGGEGHRKARISPPRSRICSVTTKRKSALVMTIGRVNQSGCEMREHLLEGRVLSDQRNELL
jgi:hypothetical protein